MTRYRKIYWKCPVCGETEKREPHWRLSEHMNDRHDMIWSESDNQYKTRETKTTTQFPRETP